MIHFYNPIIVCSFVLAFFVSLALHFYISTCLHFYISIFLHLYIWFKTSPLFHGRKICAALRQSVPGLRMREKKQLSVFFHIHSSMSLHFYNSTLLHIYNFIFVRFYIFIFKDKGSDRLSIPETVVALSTFLATIHYGINMYRHAFDRKCNLIPFSENGFSIHTFWQPLIIVWRKLQRCLFQSLHDSRELLTKTACSRHADSRNEFRMSYKYFCNLRGEFNLMEWGRTPLPHLKSLGGVSPYPDHGYTGLQHVCCVRSQSR